MSDIGQASDRLNLLREARDALLVEIRGEHEALCRKCGGDITSSLPALVRELRATLTEIDKIPGSGEVSDLDRLANGLVADLDAHRRNRTAG
jgi:hypothetical protein